MGKTKAFLIEKGLIDEGLYDITIFKDGEDYSLTELLEEYSFWIRNYPDPEKMNDDWE